MQSMDVLAKMVVALFVMLNPLGSAPMFLSLTSDQDSATRRQTVRRASITVFVVLSVAAVAGDLVLNLFGISIASFRVIGGVLFMLTALDMLNVRPQRSKTTPEEESEAETRTDIALVPLGIPMLAGPGAISTVLLFMHSAPSVPARAMVFGVILVCAIACYIILRLAGPLARKLGATGVNILTRIMGLIIGAISIEYMVGGIFEMWSNFSQKAL